MAAVTLAAVRKFVRDAMEASDADVPDSLIDLWAQDAFYTIAGRQDRWPFYSTMWRLTLTPNQREYPLAAASGLDVDVVDAIYVVSGLDGRDLWRVPLDEGLRFYSGEFDISGPPEYFAKRGDKLTIFPRPDAPYEVEIIGYRNPRNFVDEGAGGVPDVPIGFHAAICYFALAQAYGKQEDVQMAAFWLNAVERSVASAEMEWMTEHRGKTRMNRGYINRTIGGWERSMHNLRGGWR